MHLIFHALKGQEVPGVVPLKVVRIAFLYNPHDPNSSFEKISTSALLSPSDKKIDEVALLSPVKDHVTHKTIKIKPQGNEKLHAMERKKSLQKLKKGPSLISRKESVGQFPSFEEFEDTKPSDHLNQNPKLDEFEVHVTKLNFDDIANYTGTEYQFIEDGLGDGAPKGTFNTALKVENRLKNRYTNVLPFDNNRVPIGENNEYINASWIHGEIPNTQKKIHCNSRSIRTYNFRFLENGLGNKFISHCYVNKHL